MPELDLPRADRAARDAHERLRKSLPPAYPANPVEAFTSLGPHDRRGWGILTRVEEAALDVLELAAVRELEARQAQELAVEALRWLGGASAPWREIGKRIGISGQAANKRFAPLVEGPRAELTIEDELQRHETAPASS